MQSLSISSANWSYAFAPAMPSGIFRFASVYLGKIGFHKPSTQDGVGLGGSWPNDFEKLCWGSAKCGFGDDP